MIKSPEIDIAVMTPRVARAVGSICGKSGHDNVIDVHVALARERNHGMVTSEPNDIVRIDAALPMIHA